MCRWLGQRVRGFQRSGAMEDPSGTLTLGAEIWAQMGGGWRGSRRNSEEEPEPSPQAGEDLPCPGEEGGPDPGYGSRPGPGHDWFLFWEDHARKEKGSHSRVGWGGVGGFRQENDNAMCTSKLLFGFCGQGRRGPIMETPLRSICCHRD